MPKSFYKKNKCGCILQIERYNKKYFTYFNNYCEHGFFDFQHTDEVEENLLREFLLHHKKYNIKSKFKDSDAFTIYGWKRC